MLSQIIATGTSNNLPKVI